MTSPCSTPTLVEAEIDPTACVLLLLSSELPEHADQEVMNAFCGQILHYKRPQDYANNKEEEEESTSFDWGNFTNKTVYLAGNLAHLKDTLKAQLQTAKQVLVVEQLVFGLENSDTSLPGYYNMWPVVHQGSVPLLLHGVAIYFRLGVSSYHNHDDNDNALFQRVVHEHNFQRLTESTKPGWAYRLGVYLTPVKPTTLQPNETQEVYDASSNTTHHNDEDDGTALAFNLLRCSTNFEGPTQNFTSTDWYLVGTVNRMARTMFDGTAAEANHVLAQIYTNGRNESNQKSFKGTIARHSDKTKDMPTLGNGFIAFVTLYDGLKKLQPLPHDPFDFGIIKRHGKKCTTSGLTRMEFRLKDCVVEAQKDWPEAQKNVTKFSVTLYPNSVLLIPLSTNRLYTHEIKPSTLQVEDTPTRMGYVVRCSGRPAMFAHGQTSLQHGGANWKEMQPPTQQGMNDLRSMYRQENITSDWIDYGDRFPFSMNEGDYTRPEYRPQDEFRIYNLSNLVQRDCDDIFNSLFSSVSWEDVGKGRKGAVLTKPNVSGKVPLVRTTTKYKTPAQVFPTEICWLVHHIEQSAALPFDLNNALIEHYTIEYSKMGWHSDQALDMKEGSHVAVFTCYKHPELPPNRKLVIESKLPGGETFEIVLQHNHVIVFSLDTNTRFRHKIVLTEPQHKANRNEWLGVTLRTSKTFVEYLSDGRALLSDGQLLRLVEEGPEKEEFYALRGKENRETGFSYPQGLAITISESDLVPPIQKKPGQFR